MWLSEGVLDFVANSQISDFQILAMTFFAETFMIHQRAGWIEDIKLHIDNFCIVG